MAKEIAYSEPSYLYTGRDFEKYNPDSLIGRKGWQIYKKMMIDEQVKAVVKFRSDSIASRQFCFEVDQDGLSERQADERIAVFNGVIKDINGSWTDKLKGILSAIYCGFSLTEIVTDLIEVEGKSWIGLKNLKLRPFDTFLFKVDMHGNVKQIVQKVAGREIKINPKKFIHYVVNPDVDEQYGESELRAAYRAWFSKDYAIKFRNMWLERHAGGFRYIQPKEGRTINRNSTEYTALQNLLSNINTSTGGIIPPSVEYNSEYPANNVAYKEAIEDYNFAIAMALLVPNLVGITPQTQTGSYSQSEIQLQSYFETLKADIDRLEDSLNEQLFKRLGDKNWGDGNYPVFKFKPMTKIEMMDAIRLFKELVGSSAVRSFSNDEEHIRKTLGFPPLPEDADEQQPLGQPEEAEEPKEEQDEGTQEDDDGNEEEEQPKEETVMGKGSLTVSAFTKAERRVDFAVIAKNSDSIIDEYTQLMAETMDKVAEDLITKGRGEGDVDSDVSKNIKAIKTDAKLKQRLNRVSKSMLKEGVALGTKHASFEVHKAEKKEFKADTNRLDFIADDFFQTSAFKITGNLTTEAESIVEEEILNGSRYDKTWDQIETAIYTTLASNGMITIEKAKEELGQALDVTNPDARLRTIVRTSTFDAINNARHAYFTDPKLDDFVQAFEYSAILDSRTTQICRHLDDDNRGNHTKEWYDENPEYRPPNHFNAIAEGELVHTEDGLLPIEDVRVGQKVLTHKGRYKRVYAVMGKRNDTNLIRKLKMSSGDVLLVTDEHPILTSNGWFRADELKVGDNVFQRSEQWGQVPNSGSSVVAQRVLIDAENSKPLVNEPLIPYEVFSSSFGMSSSIEFEINRPNKKVHNVSSDWNLWGVGYSSIIEDSGKGHLMLSGVGGIALRSCFGRLMNILNIKHWVSFKHSFARFFRKSFSRFGIGLGPMGFASPSLHSFGVEASSLPLGSNCDSISPTEPKQGSFSETKFSLNGSNAHAFPKMFVSNDFSHKFDSKHNKDSFWASSSITSIEVIAYTGRVYNLAVEDDETYVAGNVAVHNCRSILIPVTVVDVDDFEEGREPTMRPQQGFR